MTMLRLRLLSLLILLGLVGLWSTAAPVRAGVSLTRFLAQADDDSIRVIWQTEAEPDALGFNLWRSTTPAAAFGDLTAEQRQRVNPLPIGAQGSVADGAIYELTDTAVEPGIVYYYWLETIDRAGVLTYAGPVGAALGSAVGIGNPSPTEQPGAPPVTALPTALPTAPSPATLPAMAPPQPAATASAAAVATPDATSPATAGTTAVATATPTAALQTAPTATSQPAIPPEPDRPTGVTSPPERTATATTAVATVIIPPPVDGQPTPEPTAVWESLGPAPTPGGDSSQILLGPAGEETTAGAAPFGRNGTTPQALGALHTPATPAPSADPVASDSRRRRAAAVGALGGALVLGGGAAAGLLWRARRLSG